MELREEFDMPGAGMLAMQFPHHGGLQHAVEGMHPDLAGAPVAHRSPLQPVACHRPAELIRFARIPAVTQVTGQAGKPSKAGNARTGIDGMAHIQSNGVRVDVYLNDDRSPVIMPHRRLHGLQEAWEKQGRQVRVFAYEDERPGSWMPRPKLKVIVEPPPDRPLDKEIAVLL